MWVVDGNMAGECAFAHWEAKTLSLELFRKGTGAIPLYWLDLAEAGDGFVFCSNPLPLLRIANELDLASECYSQGVQEFLQFGFANEGGALLLPVCSIPVEHFDIDSIPKVSSVECDISGTPAEDLQTLVNVLGKPFADSSLLSTLWQYRFAKEEGMPIYDGLLLSEQKQKKYSEILQRLLPPQSGVKVNPKEYQSSRSIALRAIANHVDLELFLTSKRNPMQPIDFPLSSWLRNPQSSLGQLAGDMLTSNRIADIPVDHSAVTALFDAHRNGDADNAQQLFALLTLALWSELVHA